MRRLDISVAVGASAADLEVLIMRADDQQYAATASELAALDPSLRPVADRLALTSAAVWSLSTLDSLQQEDLAYRFAEPGLLDDIVDLDDFIARAFAREKTCDILLRESVSFMEPDLVNAIHGLAVDLSRSCVKELRALDASTQREMAAALPTLDFRGIRDPSAYVRSLLRRATAGVEEIKDEPVAPVVSLSAWNAVVEAVTAVPCLAVAGEAEAILQGSLPVKAPLAVDLALALEFDGTDVEPLHVARDADTVRALVARGSDVNALTTSKECALHYAARSNDKAMVLALLEAGARPGPRFANVHGESPRDVAPPGSAAREVMDAHIAKLRQERAERNKSMRTAEDWSRALEALDTARSEAVRAGRDAKKADDEVDAIKRRDGTVLTAKVLDNGAEGVLSEVGAAPTLGENFVRHNDGDAGGFEDGAVIDDDAQ